MKIWEIQNKEEDRVDQNERIMEGENEEDSKKDEKLKIYPHKDVLKHASFKISLNLCKY